MDSIHERKSEGPESLVARAFAGFLRVAMPGRNTALTTGMTTDRKIFDFRSQRGIMAKIEYPGVAELVPRHIWDVEIARSNRVTRTIFAVLTAQKPQRRDSLRLYSSLFLYEKSFMRGWFRKI